MEFLVEPNNDNVNLECNFCYVCSCHGGFGCDYGPPSCTCNSHAYCSFAID